MSTPIAEADFFKAMTALPFVDAVYVYGSHARGDATERSNVNLAVLCPEATRAEWDEVQKIAAEAAVLVRIEVMRWDQVPAGDVFRESIDREKVPLFIRSPAGHREMMTHAFTLMAWHRKVLADAMAKEFATPAEKRIATAEHFRKSVRYFWRVARRALIVHGIRTHAPLSTFRHAFAEGWLGDRALWEQMLSDWMQLIPHGTEETLLRVEKELPRYLAAIDVATETIRKAVSQHA